MTKRRTRIFKLFAVVLAAALILIWIYTRTTLELGHTIKSVGHSKQSVASDAVLKVTLADIERPERPTASSALPYYGIRSGKYLEKTAPHVCPLEWNTMRLNITVYEADDLEIAEAGDRTDRKKPKPLFDGPSVALDESKYLIPHLRWGPNNQLVGFMESIFVAIQLNRTLVLPSFYKHDTDRQFNRGSKNRISPLHRVDVVSLCNYVSCITIDQLHRVCNYRLDGLLNIRFLKVNDIHEIELGTNMQILPKGDKNTTSLDDILIPRNGTSEKQRRLTFTESQIRKLFQSEAKCVVYPFPFFDIMSFDKRGQTKVLYSLIWTDSFRGENVPADVRLMADILKHVQRPAYIRQIASDFIYNMTKDLPFLSAHWRYNKKDYLSDWHCGNKDVNMKRCNKARNYTAQDFAKRLKDKVSSLKKKFSVKCAYIAAPKTELTFILNTSQHMSDYMPSFKIFHSDHLDAFIKERYRHCDFLKEHFDDILSTIEMEICSKSVSFLGFHGLRKMLDEAGIQSSWTETSCDIDMA